MGDAAAASSAAAAVALMLLVVAPVMALVVRRRLRRAAARREEVRRLARLAAEEAELAEREAALAYYAELFPHVVHASEAPEAPLWPPPAMAPSQEAPAPAPASAKGFCAVCYRPTTMRCKQCKSVKYCSFKCQIAHWRQGHKDECRPRSIDPRPDGGIKVSNPTKGKVEQSSESDESMAVGVEPAAKINDPVIVRLESSEANHVMENLGTSDRSNDTHSNDLSKASEDSHANNEKKPPKNARVADPMITDISNSMRTAVHGESAKLGDPVRNDSYSDDVGSYGKAEAGAQTSGCITLISDESVDNSRILSTEKVVKVQDAAIVESFSQTGNNEKSMPNSKSQANGSVGLDSKGSGVKDPSHVISSSERSSQLEQPKTQASDITYLNSSKRLSSASTADKFSSILGGQSVTTNSSKKVDSPPKILVRSPESPGAVQNDPATSVKKMVRQHTAPKVMRHYPSELTLFPYDLFVKLYNVDKAELRPFGLYNLGNSCYANAVLQCLTFTRPLAAYLLEGIHSKNCSKKEWCFICEFEKLILDGKRGKSPLSPTGILSHLRDIGSSFGPGKEEDAHEFLRYAIDTMQSVCMKEARQKCSARLAEETTLVQLIFGGYLRSKIKCTRCQVSSEQSERILDLTVEIDGDIGTLEEALHRFTSTEVLDGENKYQCSRCKSYERAKKKLTISEAPNVLTIALKRYQTGKFGKIGKAITFPEILNLANYMSATDDKSPVYRLYAVVVHHDVRNAAFSGHYVCYVKDTQGKWYKTNDSQVKPVSLEKVLSKCAYMLLYARCSPRAPSSARKVMIAHDAVRAKKAKHKLVDSTTVQGRGSLNRHQGGRLRTDRTVDDPVHAPDTFGDMPYPPAESPSPSESSSLFSNSDAGSLSTDSTDSTRNSTSTEEYEYVFGYLDQMYPGSSTRIAEDNECIIYRRSRSGLNPSSSGREADQEGDTERLVEHKHHGSSGGWFDGSERASFLYTDKSKQQCSSELTEQCRKIEETDHGPEDGRASVLLRRTRDRTAQTFY